MAFFAAFGIFILIIILAATGVFGPLPSMEKLGNPSLMQSSEVFAADGTMMGKFYRENGNRNQVEYSQISPHVINALVATEDERFFSHSGIDIIATMRAVVFLGTRGGGSTITQQLALNLFNGKRERNPAKRFIQKIKEYIIAIRLERNFTKEEILTLYLNAVPWGDNVHGIRNASRTFFQKDCDRLNIQEAAMLVGMLKANTAYNPNLYPVAARERRNTVLGQMAKNELITEEQLQKLSATPLRINYIKADENMGFAPYFRQVLRDEIRTALRDLKKANGEIYDLYDDGLRIFTTIHPLMQVYAEEAVNQQMPRLQKALNKQKNIRSGSVWKNHDKVLQKAMKDSERWENMKEGGYTEKEIKASFARKIKMRVFAWNARREKDTVMTPMDSIKYHRQMLQAGFIVMDPATGAVKAWVGGIDFKTYKFDHANITTKRQVGSSIKPLLYAQAMDERGFNPESSIPNQPVHFKGNGWVPASQDCAGLDTVSMAGALAYSLNCATAYLMKEVDPVQFSGFMKRLNIPTKVDPYPSVALGACDLSLFEMLWAYTIFPGNGYSTKPYFISRIEDRHGNVLVRFDNNSNRKEAISEIAAYKMVKMMQGTVDRGTAAGLRNRLGVAEMGGKTGTTNGNADAWFIGYTPEMLAGIWIGSDDRFISIESAQGYGGTAAMPVWESFFRKVYADRSMGFDKKALFAKPAGLLSDTLTADVNMHTKEEKTEEVVESKVTASDYF